MMHFVLYHFMCIAVGTVSRRTCRMNLELKYYLLVFLNSNLAGGCETTDAKAQTDLLLVVIKYNQFIYSSILAYLYYFMLLCISYVHLVLQHLPTSELGMCTSFFCVYLLLVAIFVSKVMNELNVI